MENSITALYVQCFLVACIGQVIHVAFKIKALKIKAKATNMDYSTKDYLRDDRISIVITMAFVVMLLFFIADVLHMKPALVTYLKPAFAFVGYSGSDFITRLFGAASNRINKVIDEKTGPPPQLDQDGKPLNP